MPHAIDSPPPITVTEFDRFLDTQRGETRYELIGGEIVAMTNPTITHEDIVGNIGGPPRSSIRTSSASSISAAPMPAGRPKCW